MRRSVCACLGWMACAVALRGRSLTNRHRAFSRAPVRHMNRLFLDEAEIADASGRVVLPGSDRRAKHVREVLWRGATAPPNAKLRVGVLDGGASSPSDIS